MANAISPRRHQYALATDEQTNRRISLLHKALTLWRDLITDLVIRQNASHLITQQKAQQSQRGRATLHVIWKYRSLNSILVCIAVVVSGIQLQDVFAMRWFRQIASAFLSFYCQMPPEIYLMDWLGLLEKAFNVTTCIQDAQLAHSRRHTNV